MRSRRTSQSNDKERGSTRHYGLRRWIDWLTVGFVIVCMSWMVVMLAIYEWHAVHAHAK